MRRETLVFTAAGVLVVLVVGDMAASWDEKVLRAAPDYRNALYDKGVALLPLGRAAEAAAAWEELPKRHPAGPQAQGLRARIDQIRPTAAGGK